MTHRSLGSTGPHSCNSLVCNVKIVALAGPGAASGGRTNGLVSGTDFMRVDPSWPAEIVMSEGYTVYQTATRYRFPFGGCRVSITTYCGRCLSFTQHSWKSPGKTTYVTACPAVKLYGFTQDQSLASDGTHTMAGDFAELSSSSRRRAHTLWRVTFSELFFKPPPSLTTALKKEFLPSGFTPKLP